MATKITMSASNTVIRNQMDYYVSENSKSKIFILNLEINVFSLSSQLKFYCFKKVQTHTHIHRIFNRKYNTIDEIAFARNRDYCQNLLIVE
jgi:hypothetical protein